MSSILPYNFGAGFFPIFVEIYLAYSSYYILDIEISFAL
jgi:hypothetical protein